MKVVNFHRWIGLYLFAPPTQRGETTYSLTNTTFHINHRPDLKWLKSNTVKQYPQGTRNKNIGVDSYNFMAAAKLVTVKDAVLGLRHHINRLMFASFLKSEESAERSRRFRSYGFSFNNSGGVFPTSSSFLKKCWKDQLKNTLAWTESSITTMEGMPSLGSSKNLWRHNGNLPIKA